MGKSYVWNHRLGDDVHVHLAYQTQIDYLNLSLHHLTPQPMIPDIHFPHNIHAIRQCRDELLGNHHSSCPTTRQYLVTLLRSFLTLIPAEDPLPHYDAIALLLQIIKVETDIYRRETYLFPPLYQRTFHFGYFQKFLRCVGVGMYSMYKLTSEIYTVFA